MPFSLHSMMVSAISSRGLVASFRIQDGYLKDNQLTTTTTGVLSRFAGGGDANEHGKEGDGDGETHGC